ncbi:SixA phosphatase family protein [Tessaracoccus caeni]|uniref:SixA phosphatase family protein n=1 Tax=Tessaracoccus caeni TaxID=3031239 RepID=UPI0023DBC97D|nr:histidine phosphatase family protein [Tessaracoccus caeni]MDF1487718.1 histidine phosphatase family protein [Tessaracoccus caeni]
MKRLVLMRHATTEHYNVEGDKARRLTGRGRQDARVAGMELADRGIQRALVSTATRTRETFEELGLGVPAEFMDALYFGGSDTILQRISETGEEVNGLIVIGHAPTIPGLVAELSYESSREEADQAQCWYPTSAFSSFLITSPWTALAERDFSGIMLEGIRRL